MAISSASAAGSGMAATGGGRSPEQSASTIVARTASGSHTLTIDGYSHIKEACYHRWKSVMSADFTVGGHTWYTQLLHHTVGAPAPSCSTIMVLRLRCIGSTHCTAAGDGVKKVSAAYSFTFLDHDGQPCYTSKVCTFTKTVPSGLTMSSGVTFAESRIATYLRGGDRLRVRCDMTVYMAPRCEDRAVPSRLVAVPPRDMGQHLSRLLFSGVGADLMFEVAGGETFAAHRCILAVRSPLLLQEITKTEAAATSCIQVCGMEAGVFKALLHYIYTDSVPEMDDEGERMDMAQHLTAAAHRYSLDRLKLICEDMLCRRVDTSTVVATLALAEECNCHGLKKACLQFLMSGSNLKAAMAAGGFEHLRSSCPSVLKELLAIVDRR